MAFSLLIMLLNKRTVRAVLNKHVCKLNCAYLHTSQSSSKYALDKYIELVDTNRFIEFG